MSLEAVDAVLARGLVEVPNDSTEDEIYQELCRRAEVAREIGRRVDPEYAAAHPVRYDVGRQMARRIFERGKR